MVEEFFSSALLDACTACSSHAPSRLNRVQRKYIVSYTIMCRIFIDKYKKYTVYIKNNYYAELVAKSRKIIIF